MSAHFDPHYLWWISIPLLAALWLVALHIHEKRTATYIANDPMRGWFHENAQGQRISPYVQTPGELDAHIPRTSTSSR